MINNIDKIKASISSDSTYKKTATESYRSEYKNKIDNDWQYASDIFTIQEEVEYASMTFEEIEARVCQVKIAETSYKGNDDWKKLMFKDVQARYGMGSLFYFFDNYWIITKTSMLGASTDSFIVRRCNDFLRWIDLDGNYHKEPCIFDYKITRNTNSKTTDITSVSGFTTITLQRNKRTQTLYPNQRFLLGTPEFWTSIKIPGAGINNYLNQKTGVYDSNAVIEVSVIESEVNANTDDLINGIADVKKLTVDYNFNYNDIKGSANDKFEMSCDITQNGNILTDRVFKYSIEDELIATVENNVVTLIGQGGTNLVCNVYYKDKLVRTTYIPIECIEAIEKRIVMDGFGDYILQGKSSTFTFHLFNGSIEDDSAIFEYKILNKNVPTANYTMSISEDTKNLTIKNLLMYLNKPLEIEASSSEMTYKLSILLKGKY